MRAETEKPEKLGPREILRRRNDSHTYSGVAYKHVPLHPAMFCNYEDDGKNWSCPQCGRKIAKHITDGDKPISVCHAAQTDADKQALQKGVYPIKLAPDTVGGVVERKNRSEPVAGVGHSLLRAFRLLRISVPVTCNCMTRLLYLSTLPIESVEKMETTVLSWLEEESNKRALFYDEDKAKKLLQIAYRHAKTAAAKLRRKRREQDG